MRAPTHAGHRETSTRLDSKERWSNGSGTPQDTAPAKLRGQENETALGAQGLHDHRVLPGLILKPADPVPGPDILIRILA